MNKEFIMYRTVYLIISIPRYLFDKKKDKSKNL